MRCFGLFLLSLCFLQPSVFAQPSAAEPAASDSKATSLVQSAIDYWRSNTSFVRATMHIHRPEWERTMSLETRTQGTDKSLIRFTAPPKDAGSASLKLGNELWTFSPKIRRVVKIPASMMHQSWMGSDFSYNDLARDEEIVQEYDHHFLPEESQDGKKVYVIEAIPKPGAPIVWGKEILKVREDKILLEHTFFDQSMKPVKQLRTESIAMLGGKLFPRMMRMEKFEEPDHWTEITHERIDFDITIPDQVFTLSYLQNPR